MLDKTKRYKVSITWILGIWIAFFVMFCFRLSIEKTSGQDEHIIQSLSLRDYQIEVYKDSLWLYDKDRLVAKFKSEDNLQLDDAIVTDNQ